LSFAPILAAESIGKSFGSRRILSAASLWLHSGSITALVGRNGQGKSTLFKIASGLLDADHGVVRFREERFSRTRLPQMARRGLFFLPERGLLSHSFTLRAHLRAVAHHVGNRGTATAVEWLHIEHLLDRYPHNLSGGERRRAELAMAVARRPDCLFADEPFLGIMPTDAEVFSDVFRRLAAEGCAIGISGHEVPTLFDLAHDVTWMTAGTTHALGPPAEARVHDQFCREYLGPRGLG
jgi:ABC-type multidrug transport system ATPase subunit